MGQEGSNINTIIDRTNVYMKEDKTVPRMSRHRVFILSGTDDMIGEAVHIIRQLTYDYTIVATLPDGKCLPTHYDNYDDPYSTEAGSSGYMDWSSKSRNEDYWQGYYGVKEASTSDDQWVNGQGYVETTVQDILNEKQEVVAGENKEEENHQLQPKLQHEQQQQGQQQQH